MISHHLKASDRKATPWRNGGGVTREVMAFPPGAGLAGFDWRLSIAEVASDGPFSVFPGVDRTMGLLTGAGLRLTVGDAPPVDVTPDDPPIQFSGDVATAGTLIDGPISDFNLMIRRGVVDARMSRVVARARDELQTGGAALLLATSGAEWVAAGDFAGPLAPLDALLVTEAARWTLRATEGAVFWLVAFAALVIPDQRVV